MGKRSVKENKSIYQICREELSLTREQASEGNYEGNNYIIDTMNGSVVSSTEDLAGFLDRVFTTNEDGDDIQGDLWSLKI